MSGRQKEIIQGSETKAARAIDLSIQALICVSLISFSLETMPGQSMWQHSLLRSIEVFCIIIFTVEYLARYETLDEPDLALTKLHGDRVRLDVKRLSLSDKLHVKALVDQP